MTDMETLESNRQLELHFPMMENEEYQKAQDQEIQLGIEQGLDVSLYKNPEFNWLQMEQIRLGLRDKIDASVYANPAYNYETMRQLRLAIYSEIDLLPMSTEVLQMTIWKKSGLRCSTTFLWTNGYGMACARRKSVKSESACARSWIFLRTVISSTIGCRCGKSVWDWKRNWTLPSIPITCSTMRKCVSFGWVWKLVSMSLPTAAWCILPQT